MRLAELQAELRQLIDQIQEMTQDHARRAEARRAGQTGAEAQPWGEAEQRRWQSLNEQYNAKHAEYEELEREAEIAARGAETREWLERRGREPHSRPDLDQSQPGDNRSYGDRGLDRDQARSLEQRARASNLAFSAWAQHDRQDFIASDEHVAACRAMRVNPAAREFELDLRPTEDYQDMQRRLRGAVGERRAALLRQLAAEARIGTGIGTSGGYVQRGSAVAAAIEVAMLAWGQFLEFVHTITTDTGEDFPWPIIDDTGNEASYVGEAESISTTSVDPGFEALILRAHDLQSGFVQIPYRAIRDSAIDIETMIGEAVGTRFGRKLNREATVGVHKARGLITRAPTGQVAASATAITYPDLVGLEHKLEPAHWPGASYMFHSSILEKVRLLVDSQGRPLFIDRISEGVPSTLNGKPFVLNQHMDSTVVSGKKTVAYGQLAAQKLRRVGRMRLKRLEERFAEKDCIAFLGLMSFDSNLLRPNTSALSPVQLLVQ